MQALGRQWHPKYCPTCSLLTARMYRIRINTGNDMMRHPHLRRAIAAGELYSFAREHGLELPADLRLPSGAPPQRKIGAATCVGMPVLGASRQLLAPAPQEHHEPFSVGACAPGAPPAEPAAAERAHVEGCAAMPPTERESPPAPNPGSVASPPEMTQSADLQRTLTSHPALAAPSPADTPVRHSSLVADVLQGSSTGAMRRYICGCDTDQFPCPASNSSRPPGQRGSGQSASSCM